MGVPATTAARVEALFAGEAISSAESDLIVLSNAACMQAAFSFV
jgi:hypothetical protein